MAFAHAFIPHTTTFPALKAQLERSAGEQSTTQLESLLTDLPLTMRDGEYSPEEARQNIGQIRVLLDQISQQSIGPQFLSDKGMVSQAIVFLLRDAVQSYATATSSNASAASDGSDPQQAEIGRAHV